MDKVSKEFLKEYLNTHTFGTDGDYDFTSLFKMFSAFEVKSLDDLIEAPNKYARFLLDNLKLIKSNDPIIISRHPVMVENARLNILSKIKSALGKPQQQFASIVSELSPNKKQSHILDVGSGQIPYSAMLFGKDFETASTMDTNFFFPDETLKSMNVNQIHKFFKADTSVECFDIVVGKAPCSAIEHIVRTCAAAGKPYFIELCDCCLPNNNSYIADWYGWENVLPDIDEYVKFYSGFAFNLDASEQQVKKVINKKLEITEYEDVLTPKQFIEQTKYQRPPKVNIPSKYWIQPDEIYDEPEPQEGETQKDDPDFLMMELFERQ